MIHFIGIGGIGMSAIAQIMLARGEAISGSDLKESPITAQLRQAGARIACGHAAKNITGASAVVVSTAVAEDNPELRAAKAAGLPVIRRGAMLAKLMRERRGIAIAGTHGKTTTTAMTAAVLLAGGIDATVLMGGQALGSGTNAHNGTAPWLLTEADESDGSFMELEPEIAVVTNIENDHIITDAELPRLQQSFAEFLARLPANGLAAIGIDNPNSAVLLDHPRASGTISFGLSRLADVHPEKLRPRGLGSTFDVVERKTSIGSVMLRVPGEINVQNALGAATIGRALGLQFNIIADALENYAGVHRRFEILAQSERMTVVDDYAHHPTAITATIAAARRFHSGPVIAAFQPHRYSRTAYLADAFAQSLCAADAVYLAPIYAASERPMEGISERCIGEPLHETGKRVRYVENVNDLTNVLLREVPAKSLVLMLGAGDITEVAANLARALQPAALRT